MPSEILSLGEFMFGCMNKWKENIAQQIPYNGHSDTYGDLLKKCIRTALKLQDLGVTEYDIVSICVHNEENACVPFVASQFIGEKVAALHPDLSKEHATYLLKLVEPKVTFVSVDAESLIEHCLKEAGIQTKIVVLGKTQRHDEFINYLTSHDDEESFIPVSKDVKETAAIVFTSGSTGCPKGVCLSHISLVHDYIDHDGPDMLYESTHFIILQYSSLYWISGILHLIRAIAHGMPLILCYNFDPAETWKIVEKYKVEVLILRPAYARDCVNCLSKDFNVDSLTIIVIVGDKVTFKLLEDITSALPNISVMNLYSQTEFAGHCFVPVLIKEDDVKNSSKKLLSCGKIPTNCDWKIVDPTSEKKLGANEKGELRIKSKCFMNGYYKTDSSSIFDADGYMKTEDLFYYDEEEYMYLVGRLKLIFIYRGWKISPIVIEEILMTHPAVEDAIVIDVPDEIDINHPMGFVKLKIGYEDIKSNDIKKFAEDKLQDYEKLRGGLRIISEIPYTVTGKKSRNAFRQSILNERG